MVSLPVRLVAAGYLAVPLLAALTKQPPVTAVLQSGVNTQVSGHPEIGVQEAVAAGAGELHGVLVLHGPPSRRGARAAAQVLSRAGKSSQ